MEIQKNLLVGATRLPIGYMNLLFEIVIQL